MTKCWTNLARGKPSTQSTGGGGDAARAVDGNADTSLAGGSCSQTIVDPSAQWEVDLEHHYTVYRVKITSSIDGVPLENVNVRIRSSDGTLITFGEQASSPLPPGGVLEFWKPEGVKGRYVSIERSPPVVSKLVLCEVEVYGALEQHFKMDAKRNATSQLLRHTSRSEMECAVFCLWEEICRSFVWNQATNECAVFADMPAVTSPQDSSTGFVSV
ncbi:fucolectin-1-like [Gigantopelta aegis]|uniref:fucolectin-1-like n=1 Tax=Gigantopelta aegis TaxID=1735272 RepID=UPI001B88C8EF|nr:fucolectin-1-like [Gigantopelta aegis]